MDFGLRPIFALKVCTAVGELCYLFMSVNMTTSLKQEPRRQQDPFCATARSEFPFVQNSARVTPAYLKKIISCVPVFTKKISIQKVKS